MKVALVNLPSNQKVIRRFRCNIFTKSYLFPPIELISLAAIPKEVVFIDAIADNINQKTFVNLAQKYNPDILIFLAGFETLEKDIQLVQVLRKSGIKVGCIGYLPSRFPNRILKRGLDFVIVGEPETALQKIIKMEKEEVRGIFKGKSIDLDKLPIPKYELIGDKYNDIFFPKSFASIEASRGCPYNCIYCIKPYGRKNRRKSVKRIMQELFVLKGLGFKNIRFLDDLFTLDKKWVKKLCKEIINERLGMKFVCLTRPDTVDEEMIDLMKKAGFVRLMIGVESGSNRMLDYYKRGYDKKTLKKNLSMIKNKGIETIGWFIVSSKDNKKSIQESLEIAKLLDWAVVSVLEPRPGTELFKKSKKKFRLFPYKTEFSSKKIFEKQKKLERKFLIKFYLRPSKMIKLIKTCFNYPKTCFDLTKSVLKYLLFLKANPRPDIF